MSYSSVVWDQALSEVRNGVFLAKVLGVAYNSRRFKKYARGVKANKGWNKEDAEE